MSTLDFLILGAALLEVTWQSWGNLSLCPRRTRGPMPRRVCDLRGSRLRPFRMIPSKSDGTWQSYHWRTAGLVGRCPCRGWRATMVHGRAEIGWLNGQRSAQHILYLHFNSLSHSYLELISHLQKTAAPRESQAPTKSAGDPRPHGVYSIEHTSPCHPRNMSHLQLSLCFERHHIQRPVISLLPFGSKHWSCRLLRFRQPAPLKYGKLQEL